MCMHPCSALASKLAYLFTETWTKLLLFYMTEANIKHFKSIINGAM
jgi:hypothetical protein